mgnify:CR=1 FL=1
MQKIYTYTYALKSKNLIMTNSIGKKKGVPHNIVTHLF